MKYVFLVLIALTLIKVSAQTIDSLAIKQVDSLIKVSRGYTEKKEFDKAFEVNAVAEKIALKEQGRESAAFASCAFNRGRVNYYKRDFPEAEKWYMEAMAIRKNVLGVENLDYAWCLNNLGLLYKDLANYQKAETLFKECLAIRVKLLGKEDPNYASSLYYLGSLYEEMGNYEKGEPLLIECMAIREKILGMEHPDYHKALIALADLYKKFLKFDKAESLYLQLAGIRKKTYGKESTEYARTLIFLSILYEKMGKLDDAESQLLQSLSIFEKGLSKLHPYYVDAAFMLARVYDLKGNYNMAETLYLENLASREKISGKESDKYTICLNDIGVLYWQTGQLEKALKYYQEASAIAEKVYGKVHPDYAFFINNEGAIYQEMGNFERAELSFLECKDITEKLLGKEHISYGEILINLSLMYTYMGNYKKAEQYMLEVKVIWEKILGKEDKRYALLLHNLALLYVDIGDFEKAEPLYLTAIAIREKIFGKEHADYAETLEKLAQLYSAVKNEKKAESFFLTAKAIFEKTIGKDNTHYATTLTNLATLYKKMGEYEKAEKLYLEAKLIFEKRFGKNHPDYKENLRLLAGLYQNMGKNENATALFLEISDINQTLITNGLHHLSEKELNFYMQRFLQNQDQVFTFTSLNKSEKLISSCYDNSLFYKGFLLNASNQIKRIALSDSLANEEFSKLKSYERRLAALYSKTITERDSASVLALEGQSNQLQKDLTRRVSGYGKMMRQVKWNEVQATLKNGEAAVEFIKYNNMINDQAKTVEYLALILKPGEKGPLYIPLFEEKSLDSLLHSESERKADYVNSLYTLADRGAVAVETPKKSLYDILWKPLEKELNGIKTIYFSPSGLLHRINLEAIPISETETLADKYQLVEVNSTRQLVIPNLIKKVNNDAVLYGGIQFEQDSTLQNNEPLVASRSRGELSFNYVDSTLRGGSWNYLAGTEREVNSIERIMQEVGVKITLKKGNQATEESFKNIGVNNSPSPKILHIATHGYFFADPKSTTKNNGFDNQNEPVFKMSDHPMLRSGLIMAGGNAAWQGKQTLEGREDGILTAYEISQMNLSNTELVVLSACETGLGEIQGNEGVYGLQRAFKIAGAKYLIMSLWQVPDKQTSLLMTTFYKKWLEDKMTIPDAFHSAQKELRDNGLDPYNWAGFVLVE